MFLVRLVYISTIKTEHYTNEEVLRILKSSRENNQERDITGLLIFDKQFFMQCLEGSREQVSNLYLKIAADERHENVQLVSVEEVDEPMFDKWSMGFVADISENREIINTFSPEGFDPYTMSSSECANMLQCYAKNRDLV